MVARVLRERGYRNHSNFFLITGSRILASTPLGTLVPSVVVVAAFA